MPDGDSTSPSTPLPARQRSVPRVNMNQGTLDQARGIANYAPSAKLNQSTGMGGDVAARDYMKREYGNQARELDVPRRGNPASPRRVNQVPILDLVFDIGNGEYVVVEAKGSVHADGRGPSYGRTNDRVFRGGPSGGAVETVRIPDAIEQSTPAWFEQRLAELRRRGGAEGRRLAHKLDTAWNQGKLRSIVVHATDTLHSTEVVTIYDRTAEWNRHRNVNSTLTKPMYGPIAPIRDPARLLAAGTSDVSRGLQAVEKADGAARGAQQLVRGVEGGHAVQGLERAAVAGVHARTLVIGVKAWRAVRTIGKIVVLCFVPLKVLDLVFEVALAIFDRKRKEEERRRKINVLALQAVFKEDTKLHKAIERDILTNQTVQEDFLRRWDNDRRFLGFMYARVMAELEVEYVTTPNLDEMEGPRTHRIVSLTAYTTNAAFAFEVNDMNEKKEISAYKFVQRRKLLYTIVPPLLTPFDTVVTKINNLFLDTAYFIAQFSKFGDGLLNSFRGFDYRDNYAEQFGIQIDFPAPLNQSVCEYCLAYLHWAAKILSQHPLTREDLADNLEDPVRGWKRRRWLLNHLLEGKGYSKHGKNFSYLASQMPRLVKNSNVDPTLKEAMNELYVGARMIWYDLERIERNLNEPEYFYMGGEFTPPKR